MLLVANCKFKNDSMDEWVEFYNNQASKRANFVKQEKLGIAGDSETLFWWEVESKEHLMEHGSDPEVAAHVARMEESADVYEVREIQESDGPGQYFGIWTFENETAEEWIQAWLGDDKRLSRNEVFGIVDDNTVMALIEAVGTPEQHEQHLQRPEVKEHIARTNEKASIWKAEQMQFD